MSVVVGGAAGHVARVDSTVTAKFDKRTAMIEGTVDSVKRGCLVNRKVTLMARATDGSITEAGTTATDSAGAWAFRPPAVGTYFAEAAKKVLRKNAEHRHLCRAAVSKDVTVK